MSDIINYSGVLVDLDVAEEALRQRDDVSDVVAVGVADNYLGQALNLYVVPGAGMTPSNTFRSELIGVVADRFDGLKPRNLRFVTRLPQTADGRPSREIVTAVVMGEIGDLHDFPDSEAVEAVRNAR